MPAVSLLAFPLFSDSDSVFIKHLGFWTLSSRGFPTHFPCRNPSVFYSPVHMPLLPGSPLPFSLHILVRGQKKKKKPTNTSIVWSASLNTVEHLFSQAWRTLLSFGGSKQPYTSSPLLSGEIGIDHSGWQGWARLVQKGNGLTLAGFSKMAK